MDDPHGIICTAVLMMGNRVCEMDGADYVRMVGPPTAVDWYWVLEVVEFYDLVI